MKRKITQEQHERQLRERNTQPTRHNKPIGDNQMTTQAYIDIVQADIDYNTSHKDAADGYSTLTDEHVKNHYGIDRPYADNIDFGNEHCLPLTDVQRDDPFNDTGWLKEDRETRSWVVGRTIYVTVYLGNGELETHLGAMGIELPTDDQIFEIESATDSTYVNGACYSRYPQSIIAEYEYQEATK